MRMCFLKTMSLKFKKINQITLTSILYVLMRINTKHMDSSHADLLKRNKNKKKTKKQIGHYLVLAYESLSFLLFICGS